VIFSIWHIKPRSARRICVGCLALYFGPPWCSDDDCKGFGEPLCQEAT
jgi:hypothetical protein